jgi:hypothetical protein
MADAPDPAAALAALKSRHYRIPDPAGTGEGICESDRHRWPCHAHRALSALEAVLKLADEADSVGWDIDPARVREAITRELAGEEARGGDGS